MSTISTCTLNPQSPSLSASATWITLSSHSLPTTTCSLTQTYQYLIYSHLRSHHSLMTPSLVSMKSTFRMSGPSCYQCPSTWMILGPYNSFQYPHLQCLINFIVKSLLLPINKKSNSLSTPIYHPQIRPHPSSFPCGFLNTGSKCPICASTSEHHGTERKVGQLINTCLDSLNASALYTMYMQPWTEFHGQGIYLDLPILSHLPNWLTISPMTGLQRSKSISSWICFAGELFVNNSLPPNTRLLTLSSSQRSSNSSTRFLPLTPPSHLQVGVTTLGQLDRALWTPCPKRLLSAVSLMSWIHTGFLSPSTSKRVWYLMVIH